MRVSTELIVEGYTYGQLIKNATEHWRNLTEDGVNELPTDTEMKVRNDGDKYTGYVVIRYKIEE